jgi:surfactin synthase thioesterase subunit
MYAAWHDTAAAWLDVYPVEYPGHGSRIREQLVHKPDSMAAEIAEGLLSLDSKPFALFGHSMGTVVTWKVMREVQRRGEIHRLRLIALSGRPVPSRLPKRAPRYKLPTEQFLVEVERYNGLPKEIYQYPELLELYLPILRNDFRIADEGYDDPGIPIPVPVITFSGEDDPDILPGGMEGWATHSEQWLGHYIFPGHHFYLAETQVRHEILRFMEKHLMK